MSSLVPRHRTGDCEKVDARIQLQSLQRALQNMRAGKVHLSQEGVAFVRGTLRRTVCPDDLSLGRKQGQG